MNAITKGYQDVPMTRRRAQLLAEYADKLAEMLENAPDNQDLAEWVQSKIDRAAGAIQSAYHYLDQEDDEDLEKAVGHKYTHRKRVGTDKRGRARYRYYYAEHQGGGITRASFEAGSAFKLTYKGRRGHFHIHHVEGDQVFITHDSRPDMEPVSISKSELRALLKRQHTKAEQAHVEKRRKEVERIKSRNVKRGLGLALHRLRQAATQAGVELDERYQRKPKKKKRPAQATDTPREDRFDTMPEVEESETSFQEAFDKLNKIYNELPPPKGRRAKDTRVADALKQLSDEEFKVVDEYLEEQRQISSPIIDPKTRLFVSTNQKPDPVINSTIGQAGGSFLRERQRRQDPDRRSHEAVTVTEVNDLFEIGYTADGEIIVTPRERLEESVYRNTLTAMGRLNVIAAWNPTLSAFSTRDRREADRLMQKIRDLIEATAPTPRNELTETAQQIIEEANQEHEERHDEHQEITKFELGEHTHTKTGQKLFTAKQTERVDRDEYFRRVEIAKKHRGRYERRYVKGFVFKNAEDARNFALEVEGAAQEAPETSAETVTPHEDHPSADNFETMPEVESAPRSRVVFREKVEELKRLEDELIGFTNSLARPQGLTKEQEKDILDKMQAEIAKKRDELTEGFTRPQSSAELEARLKSFLPKLKGLDYSRVEGYRLYIDKEHKAPLRAQIKELMGTGLNISPANLKNYGLNVAGSFKDMVRLLFALENDAKGTPRGHLTPSRLYGMDHETASWHDIVDATGQGDLSGRKLKDLDLSEIQTSIDFYVSILESYKDDPRTYKRFRRQTDKKLRDLKRYVRTRKAEGRIKGERPPAPPESKPTPTPTADLTQQEKRDALLSLMPTTPREQLTETAREVTQGADNFETMPEVESARAITATVRDVQSTLKASRRADKLTSTGRRARASINADKELIEAAQRALDEGYKGMESPAFIPLNERTPRQANYQRLKGALNGFKSSQTLTRGSWTDDHKSLQKKRIKARDQLDEALKELDQIARSQEHTQVSIEDLPPKGQRTIEDAKRFFGEPRYFERIEGSKTKRYVIYERDGHRIVGPASGRGKGKFSRSFSWDTPRYRREREQGNIIQSFSDLTYEQIGDYDTLDEALTRTINQYRSQDEMIDKLIEKEKERLAQGRRELERLNTPTRTAHTIVLDRLLEAKRSGNEAQEAQANEQLRPQLMSLLDKIEQGTLDDGERQALLSRYQELQTLTTGAAQELAQEIVSRLQGEDNFETISDEHKEFIQNKTREFSRELMSGLIYDKTKRGKIKSLQRQVTGDMESALVKIAISALRGKEVTNSNVKQFIASKISGERAEETQGRLSALLSVGDTVEDKQDILYKQALIEAANHIDEIAQGLSVHDKDFSEAEHRAVKQRTAYLRVLSAEIETEQPAPTPSPAREQLTETVRELSDQPARTAAVSSTPRASEATLTGSGDLSDTERRDLTNRARFITSGSEETTKTGRRSRAQKAKDQELLLIYNRLHSDASARLGPLAPRFADYSQFVKLQGGDLPERAQTRADFRTGIMSSIEELRNATTAQPTSSTQKSANHLIDYRAQLLQTIERIA